MGGIIFWLPISERFNTKSNRKTTNHIKATNKWLYFLHFFFNPSIPTCDHRQNFSLHYQYNIKQTSNENKKISIRGLLVDPTPNSPNKHQIIILTDI